MIKRIRTTQVPVLAVAVVILAAACGGGDEGGAGGGTDAGARKQVDVGLSSGAVSVFMYYVAETLDYYGEEGLDVTLTPTEGSSDVAQQLAAGNFHLGQASSTAVLPLLPRVDLHPFYTVITKEWREWIVAEESAISSVSDLEGTTVGVSDLSGGEIPVVRYLLEQNGIDPDRDVEIVDIGEEPASVIAAFQQDRIQSYAGSKSALIPVQELGEVSFRSIFPEEFSSGPVEVMWATEQTAQDRDLLVSFGRATAKGTLFCETDVEACLDVIGQDHPELVQDRETTRKVLEVFIDLTEAPEEGGQPQFGPLFLDSYDFYIDILSTGEDAEIEDPEAIDVESLAITGLQDDINNFDREAVIEQAQNYSA